MIQGTYVTWRHNEHENLQFDNEQDIRTGFENYETTGYGHDLELRITLHWISACFHIVQEVVWDVDPKLPDDSGEAPKSERRGWRFDSWL